MDETEVLRMTVERLMKRVEVLERDVATLRRVEVAAGCPISTVDVAGVVPTDAELDGAFGAPGDISRGMLKLINDNGAETTVWGAVPIGGSWWYWTLVKAV